MGAHEKRKVCMDRDLAWRLYQDGCDCEYIAEQCGVVAETVRRWLRGLGKAPHEQQRTRQKKTRRLTQLEQDALDAYELGMTYGQYKARYPVGRKVEKA